MSQFLSNILSRHSQSENNVQPRGMGVFETPRPGPESFPSEAVGEHVEHNTQTPPSEKRVIEPLSETNITTETIQNNNSEKNDSGNLDEKLQILHVSNTKTQQADDHIIEKMRFKIDKEPAKDLKIARAEAYFGRGSKNENMVRPVHSKRMDPNSEQKIVNENTKRIEGQDTTKGSTDPILVKPNMEMRNQFSTQVNLNLQNGNEPKGYYSEETSQESQAPTIKIHIGRIDIKAIKPTEPAPRKVRKPNNSTLSLDQFLKNRERKQS